MATEAAEFPVPVNGCWVRRSDIPERTGIVLATKRINGAAEVHVRWHKTNQDSWVSPKDICSGFQLGMEVQEVPFSRTRKSLGEGVVLETRSLGKRHQVLVEYYESGRRVWIPYENLRAIKGVRQRFILGDITAEGGAERFRLKCLARALELWNQNTGALSRLNIDPLPHQIHLVHHILASGNLNWLIADDVGLGKTIEVGMLLAALQHRGTFRRILLVTPAGLVRQWQEELHHKFQMSDFQIYGTDFEINNPRHWRLHDRVIASIDRLKSEAHLDALMEAGHWDLVVFDEAHRLSRRQWGSELKSSERFKLAAAIRRHTDAMILLSATPHQGMPDKFQALLELLRPEITEEIRTLDLHPEILRDMVIRNHKADVTDANGNFIFKKKITKAITIPIGEEEKEFDRQLQAYLKNGYAASKRKGRTGLAIGFVMTVYRKLAASSIAAITAAIERRIDRLKGEAAAATRPGDSEDERFAGETEEFALDQPAREEFFAGEIRMLEGLRDAASRVLANDRKLAGFIGAIVEAVGAASSDEKLLIFTEYRSTQSYLAAALRQRFGDDSVALIHGSMDYEEREAEIARFNDQTRFLVSTEAGGEGLNLHRRCHILVNYDLPWNPMRIVQRVGRLYRYGQQQTVVVLNLHAPQTMDAQIMDVMYSRIAQVVHDMAAVGEEFRDGLEDEILGDLSDMLDVQDILEEATDSGIVRTKERIDQALNRAREAALKQRDLFEHAVGFDPAETRRDLQLSSDHLKAFFAGMAAHLGIEIVESVHSGRAYGIRLSEEIRQELQWSRSRLQVTFDRTLASDRRDVEMLDFQSSLFQLMLERAKAHAFGGACAGTRTLAGEAIVTAILRWQNDQGLRMREEFAALLVDEHGRTNLNPSEFAQWLLRPATDGGNFAGRPRATQLLDSIVNALDDRLAELSSVHLHPENRQLVASLWCDSHQAGSSEQAATRSI